MSERRSQVGFFAATAATVVGCYSSMPPPPTDDDLEGDDDVTVIELWSQHLVGATVSVAGQQATVDEGGIARIELRPGLRATSVTVDLTRDGARLTLTTRWDDEFAFTRTSPTALAKTLVLRVMRAPDGTCTLTRPLLDAGGVTRTETLPRDWEDRACMGWRTVSLRP